MKAHFKYAGYVARHKWFVFLAGLRTGAPVWRLIVHDWSKFTPAEWGPYVASFHGGYKYDERPPEVVKAFDRAWLHHIHGNAHHWDHWILKEGGASAPASGFRALPMPEALVREMVADWIGAGRAQGHGNDVRPWYEANRDKMLLHEHTRLLVERLLGIRVAA